MKDTDRRAYNIVPPNSFAYNPARINVGSLGYYTGSENVIVSSLYEVFQTEDYIDDRFLWHWLKSDHFPKWIEKLQEGSVRLYFYFDKLVQCQMMVPTIKEQKQISAYFDSLDELITLHQCKPINRWHCEKNVWEQRKLGEMADIVGGGTPSTNKMAFWDGDIDWYAPAEIGTKIYLDSSERKITSEGFNSCSAKMLPVGTVLFTSRAGIGKTAILAKEGCTNQGFQSIVPHKNELDSYFIYSRTEELKRYGEVTGAGSTFVEVSGKQMANMDIMMPPSIDEQVKIGDYFKKIDHLITLHQRKPYK